LRRNCLLQQVIEGKIEGGIAVTEDEEEDVGSYGMTLRKGEGTEAVRSRFEPGRDFLEMKLVCLKLI
jgi:hypothetical protein